jgi:hypothetical protein
MGLMSITYTYEKLGRELTSIPHKFASPWKRPIKIIEINKKPILLQVVLMVE